jgi:superfamily II DNA/RNA helicase
MRMSGTCHSSEGFSVSSPSRRGSAAHRSTSTPSARPSRNRRRGGGSRGPRPAAAPRRSAWDDLTLAPVPTENLPAFADLGLPADLVRALSRRGMTTPFPIQAATIPTALAGRDLLSRAATGSGKTLAFGLPLLARLAGGRASARRPRGLVLVPTRELAMQVVDALTPLADAGGVTVRLVAGGLPIGKQVQSLERGVDLLVATPGRLEDLIARRSCDLGAVETVVLDEADHMADLGFLPVVRRLLDQTPRGGQRLLFSATLDGEVGTLVENYLTDPAAFALHAVEASVDRMSHHLFRVAHADKFDLAAEIVGRPGRTIAFVRTKHGADRVARNLGRVGVPAGVLHGGRTQGQRTKALDAFKDGSVPVLVATDVAARGIHVDDVSLVLHLDPPADPKDYLHRSGRTARAGESGVVVVLSTPEDERDTAAMLRAAGVRPETRDVRTGDINVARITGARPPSGEPIARPARPARPTPRADGSAPHPRSGRRSGGPRRNGAPRSATGDRTARGPRRSR